MKNREKRDKVLFCFTALCFFIAALIGKNLAFVPIGSLFLILGTKKTKDKSNSDGKDKSNCKNEEDK